jgi:hypothetical protein
MAAIETVVSQGRNAALFLYRNYLPLPLIFSPNPNTPEKRGFPRKRRKGSAEEKKQARHLPMQSPHQGRSCEPWANLGK